MNTGITTTAADLAAPAAPGPAVTPADARIEGWKAQGHRPYSVTVKLESGEDIVAYFKKADRNVLAYALTLTFNKKVLEAGEFIMKNTFLGGDERLNPNSAQADDDAIVAGAITVAGKTEMLSAEVKKL